VKFNLNLACSKFSFDNSKMEPKKTNKGYADDLHFDSADWSKSRGTSTDGGVSRYIRGSRPGTRASLVPRLTRCTAEEGSCSRTRLLWRSRCPVSFEPSRRWRWTGGVECRSPLRVLCQLDPCSTSLVSKAKPARWPDHPARETEN